MQNVSGFGLIALKILLLGMLYSLGFSPALANDDIQLQLKWRHAVQFAGYYMAKEKGFYEEAGLNVMIIEGSPNKSPILHVVNDEGHYAISDTGALLAKARGIPIKALAAVFQHSPLTLAVREDSGIKSFADLRGKRVMMQQDDMDAIILAAIYKAGLTDADFTRQSNSFNLHDLIDGKTDAFSIYTSDQPNQLKNLSVDYRVLYPSDYDVDFYGDIIITSDHEAESHSERAAAFTKASLKGWDYALEHFAETIELIHSKYNTQHLSSEQLGFEAKKTAELILKDEIDLGYMSEYRWQQMAKTYAELGLIPHDVSISISSFLFQQQLTFNEILKLHGWQLAASILLLLLAIAVMQAVMLKRMVGKRTAELKERESLQMSIASILEMVASDKDIKDVFEYIIRIFEARNPNMKASILLLRGTRLYQGAAPSLPDEYNQAIEGVEIGPMVGSCGTAAYLKQRVIVEDIATDPRWEKYSGLALPLNLKACWSEPIISADGQVQGTFAMYYDHPCSPGEDEIKDILTAAKLVGIAIERRDTQENLRKLSQATEQAGESVIITDKDGVIEYVNPSFTKMTGYSAAEVLGKNPRVIKSGLQADTYYEKLWETISKGDVWQKSIVDRRKDGTVYPAVMTVSPIMDKNNEISHYVGSQVDMTTHEMLEEKFHQAQKMEALGILVGGIAHDFNNTLAAMSGNLYLARMETKTLPEVDSMLKKVEDLSFTAAETIKQLMTFARKGMMKKKQLNLTTLMKDISKLHKSTIPENIALEEKYCEQELIINGDATQLQQVLINILNNACDAVAKSDEPKIILTLKTFEPDANFINMNPDVNAKLYALITVTDNGKGMSEKDKEHVFEPFFTTKDVGLGTGLGLSMVYGSIQSHEGVVVVESSLGEGTTFHVYIPLLDLENKQIVSAPEENVIDTRGSGETILFVDDDLHIRTSGKGVLERIGYKVIEAADGLEAVEIFATHEAEIALVITDVVMPTLGGVMAIERIRKIRPDTKVIFCTGYDKDTSLPGVEPSVDTAILTKPYKVELLGETIRKLLNSERGV